MNPLLNGDPLILTLLSQLFKQQCILSFIIRDYEGCTILSSTRKTNTSHVSLTEALALGEGIFLALQ